MTAKAASERDVQPTGDQSRPVSLVTGGSEGIGLAIAERLAGRGHDLVLVARRSEPLDDAARHLRQRYGVEVTTLPLDLTVAGALPALDEQLIKLGAHVRILVNCAGVGHCGPFIDADPGQLDRIVALNATVPTCLMRHFLPDMRQRGTGGVLNIASLGGYVPGPYQAVYYASKGYLISLSEALAAEVTGSGVRVTVVAPGPVDSLFHEKMRSESAIYRRFLPALSPDDVAKWALRGFDLGLRVVIPGFINLVGFAALRIVPHRILVPFMAVILQPRGRTGTGTNGDA